MEQLHTTYDNSHNVTNAIHYLTRNILSALRLGDLAYVGSNLAWIEGMMINHNMPVSNLRAFLATYNAAATHYLSASAGRLVLDWLGSIAALPDQLSLPTLTGE